MKLIAAALEANPLNAALSQTQKTRYLSGSLRLFLGKESLL